MNKLAILTLALAACASTTALAQDAMSASDVSSRIAAQGFTDVHDVEFEDGLWEADARAADGRKVKVHLDAKTGTVYPNDQGPHLGEADLRARLADAGYLNVHDVKYKHGLWQADADGPEGKDLDLKMDPVSGAVISVDR